jgi:glycosyltransferase involved in cell wall biosynthesis
MQQRFGVLFLQSQAFFGADSTLHAQLMQHLDRSAVEVHVALTTEPAHNPATSAARAIGAIPDLAVRPTDFGPSVHGAGRLERLRRGGAVVRLGLSLASLAAYIRRHRIRVIHCTEKPRDAFYGVLLGKLTGARTVIHMHVAYGDWMSRGSKWALGQADTIVAISEFVASSLVQAGYRREQIAVVPNALDLSRWDPDTDGRPVRRELGIADDAPVVGIISRLFRWKGHEYLVEAMASVTREVPGARLVIVGEDDPRAAWETGGSFSGKLKEQAARLGIASSVLFTGFRTDVPQLMAAFDVFAHPSWEEPFGMVFLEAMAMRRPVVAWASGGAPEVVESGATGLLVPREAVSDLADALVQLLRDAGLRQRMGAAGRQRVESLFTAERMAERMLDVYRGALSARLRPAPAQPHPARA